MTEEHYRFRRCPECGYVYGFRKVRNRPAYRCEGCGTPFSTEEFGRILRGELRPPLWKSKQLAEKMP